MNLTMFGLHTGSAIGAYLLSLRFPARFGDTLKFSTNLRIVASCLPRKSRNKVCPCTIA
jgi:hypothetical protein